jgi:hypothetical protein
LKPEWWGSPLAQEQKYRTKRNCDKRTIIIIIIIIIIIGSNNNNNRNNHADFDCKLTYRNKNKTLQYRPHFSVPRDKYVDCSILMTETVRCSETSVNIVQTTQHNIG